MTSYISGNPTILYNLKIKSIVVFSLIAHETETENRKIPWVFPEWIFQ